MRRNRATEPTSSAIGEFSFVLQFLVEEWGDQNIMILAPHKWKIPLREVGIPIYFASDETITIVVDCSDHYIQYHIAAAEFAEATAG